MATENLEYLDESGMNRTAANVLAKIAAAKAQIEAELNELDYALPNGIYPDMTVGAVICADETAQWATRESTRSGTAIVRSVQGAAEVINGELVPVNIAGIRSVDFNQWDEVWEIGALNTTTGVDYPNTNTIRSKNYVPLIAGATYYMKAADAWAMFYDSDKAVITSPNVGNPSAGTAANAVNVASKTFTVPSGAAYMRFYLTNGYGTTYNGDVCVNISNPALNGQYKPYTTDSVEWTAQTLRAAGSVRDELTADELVTRVGVIVLTGNEPMSAYSYLTYTGYILSNVLPQIGQRWAYSSSDFGAANNGDVLPNTTQFAWLGVNNATLYLQWANCPYATAADLSAWLAQRYAAGNPVTFFYELATPTTTPISPALPMTYKVQQGGSESIIVPDGEVSAAPVLTIAERVNMSTELARIWAAIEALQASRQTLQSNARNDMQEIAAELTPIDVTKEVQQTDEDREVSE